jgi:hypothetical protein
MVDILQTLAVLLNTFLLLKLFKRPAGTTVYEVVDSPCECPPEIIVQASEVPPCACDCEGEPCQFVPCTPVDLSPVVMSIAELANRVDAAFERADEAVEEFKEVRRAQRTSTGEGAALVKARIASRNA